MWQAGTLPPKVAVVVLSEFADSRARRARSRGGAPLTRIFVDAEGVEWEVVEQDGTRVPAARGDRCLVFRSSNAIRRVWNYPPLWADLGIRELIDLSWNR
jgi:hypothetical protein